MITVPCGATTSTGGRMGYCRKGAIAAARTRTLTSVLGTSVF